MRKRYGMMATGRFVCRCALKSSYETFSNMISKKQVELQGDHYILTYTYRGNVYKVMWKKLKISEKPKVKRVLDSEENDVTKHIKQYMGPSHNFHGTYITPRMLGYKKLIFELYLVDNRKVFSQDNVIIL